MAVSYSAGSIPPRAMLELSSQLGIQTPPFGDAWKLTFLPASSDIVFNLNCRMKDGKVLINQLSGSLECSSIDVNDWGQTSASFKFLYAALPRALSLSDAELVLRVSANAEAAKLTIKFLKDSSGGGDAAAQKLKEMFADGQFHKSFGRIISSMCCPPPPSPSLYSHSQGLTTLLNFCSVTRVDLTRFCRVYGGQKTDLKLSGLDESMPGTHIFLIYLGCLASVFLSWHGVLWYRQHTKDPQAKILKLEKKAALAKRNDVSAVDKHSV